MTLVLGSHILELQLEIMRLRRGLWDVAAASGMDTDGRTGPEGLLHPNIVDFALRGVRELRSEYDEMLMEMDELE